MDPRASNYMVGIAIKKEAVLMARYATLTLAAVTAFVALFASKSLALDNGAGLVPPIGWSTWCSDGNCGLDYCSEVEVKQAAEAMVANGMFALGYNWVILDDCWAYTERASNGSLTWDPFRFPSGIPALTQWLHDRGFLFGLYTSAGNVTCSSGGRRQPVPGSEGHYQQDMNSFAAWNVDFVKADWCGDVKKLPIDGIAVGAKDYIALSDAITNTTPKRTMYLEGVAAVLFLLGDVAKYMNAWRASTDHHDQWSNTMEVLATVQIAAVQGAPGAWSDLDVLMTGGQGCNNEEINRTTGTYSDDVTSHCPGMTDDEYVSEYSLWNLMQSPLIVGTDVRNMTAIMRKVLLNKRFVTIHQNTQTPPGHYAGGDETCAYGSFIGRLACQVWLRPLIDGSVLAVLFNAQLDTSSSTTSVTLDFDTFASHLPSGWGSNTTVYVEDLWNQTSAKPTATGKYSSPPLAPHSVNAVVLHPVAPTAHRRH
jgi:alpha-galactosidase